MKIRLIFSIILLMILGCADPNTKDHAATSDTGIAAKQYLVVLGVAQDAGFPHINNPKEWAAFEKNPNVRKQVTSLGLVDAEGHKKWLFEATPDMPQQLDFLEQQHLKSDQIIDGVFITHAHIGHYTGLMHFGREAMGAKEIKVHAMPKMKTFLEQHGPWSQLVALKNIAIQPLYADSTVVLNKNYKVTPFLVPHRDEFSETVGYKITGPNKSALFIPDINKWNLWERSIVEAVKQVDYAFLDATFFKEGEIPRPMSEVPHPFIEETMALFENESEATRSKIIFIHFNHSNPAILETHEQQDSIQSLGYKIAKKGQVYEL